MRVLLISPKNDNSFWTFPEQCLFAGRKAMCPPIGLITVAALLPPDWELRVADLHTRSLTEADWEWAELVMITGMTVHRSSFKETVAEAKRRGKIVVAGGPYPTSMSEDALAAGCDFLVRGEAENTLPLLLQALKEGRTHGVFEHPEKPDVSMSPVPRFDLLKFDDYMVMAVQTSRGCPFDCEFCDVVNLYGRRPRFKTPEQVIAELETILRLGFKGDIFVSDDNFIGHKAHTRALLAQLTPWNIAHGEPFGYWTQASVNLGQDLEMIDLMTAANFGHVLVGIESPDEEVLVAARKFHNLKNPLVESVNNITRNGLTVLGSFILGMDGEKPGAGGRICSFIELTSMPVVTVNTLQAAPNTSLWNRLTGEGRLVAHDAVIGEGTFANRLNFIPTRPESQILGEHRAAWNYLYEPSRFHERNYRYHLAMRPTRAAIARSRGESPPKRRVSRKVPSRKKFEDLRAFLQLCWRQGIRSSCWLQFWRCLFGILKRNPSRFREYVVACVMGEDMFRIRAAMHKSMNAIPGNRDGHTPAAAALGQKVGPPGAEPVASRAEV